MIIYKDFVKKITFLLTFFGSKWYKVEKSS